MIVHRVVLAQVSRTVGCIYELCLPVLTRELAVSVSGGLVAALLAEVFLVFGSE